ncbi:MAG: hypothetical protein ACYTGH_11560 [Planctomycetota bacterium]|jgi:hypothetical protein
MSSYPYLLAQLPSLSFSDESFPSHAEFLEQAEKWLPESEFETLARADLHDFHAVEHEFELLAEWSDYQHRLRKDIAGYRESHRLGHDHKTHMFPTAVVKDETPLAAEIQLLAYQWEFLAERGHVHYDDLIALVIYALQLQILERKAAFDAERGRERFDRLADIEALDINLEGYRWQRN